MNQRRDRGPQESPTYETRLSRVEESVQHISSSQDAMVRDMRHGFEALNRDVRQIADRVASGGRTHWGAIAAWAGVVLTVVGLVLYGYGRDSDRTEKKTDQHTLELSRIVRALDRIDERSHVNASELDRRRRLVDEVPEMRARLSAIQEDVGDLGASIRSEARLLDEPQNERLRALERVVFP